MSTPTLFVRILKQLMNRFATVEVIGREHLQSSKGLLVVANHIGWADPLWIGYAAYPVFLQQMAKRELFETPFMRWFVSSGGGFPVDRHHASPATIKQTIALLELGGKVLIFPQGTRSQRDTGVKRGAATIALHAKVDIVPAHYEGPTAIAVKHLFTRPRIRIVFGEPIKVTDWVGVNKNSAIELTQQIDLALKANY